MIAGQSIQSIAIADIAIGARVGFFDAAHAETLAISLAADGQRDPIHLRRNGNAAKQPWSLIAGRHRLAAAVQLGWSEIASIQVADEHDDDKACRKLELSENLDHRNPRPLERALFIAARRGIEEALAHPDHVGERSQDRANRLRHAAGKADFSPSATMADGADWKAQTAATVGCPLRTFERYLGLYDKLIRPYVGILDGKLPDFAEALNAHPLGERLSNLTRIAEIKDVQARRRLIHIIIAHPDIATMDEAKVLAEVGSSTGTRAADGKAATAAFLGTWKKMRLPEQVQMAKVLAGTLSPTVASAMLQQFNERGLIQDFLKGEAP